MLGDFACVIALREPQNCNDLTFSDLLRALHHEPATIVGDTIAMEVAMIRIGDEHECATFHWDLALRENGAGGVDEFGPNHAYVLNLRIVALVHPVQAKMLSRRGVPSAFGGGEEAISHLKRRIPICAHVSVHVA